MKNKDMPAIVNTNCKDKLIALVVTNLAGSGAEKVVLNLFKMFRDNGANVYIFLLENKIQYELDESEKEKLIFLTDNRKYYKLFSGVGDKLLANKLFEKILFVESKYRKSFDLILSNLPYSDRVCNFLENRRNIHFIIHTSYLQELQQFRKNGKYKRAQKKEKLYKYLYNDKKLIAVSDGIIDDVNKLGINYRKIVRIYNPFNFDAIRSQGNKNFTLLPQYRYVICASAFRTVKRYDILLSAYKQSGINLTLVLLCKPEKDLVTLINSLGISSKVKILGFQKNPYPFIKNAEMLVLSSEREGLPTVLVESLILGTPVVSTDCISGPSEILTGDQKKYLAKVNDFEDLANKMTRLLKEDDNKFSLSIEKFAEHNILQQYLALI